METEMAQMYEYQLPEWLYCGYVGECLYSILMYSGVMGHHVGLSVSKGSRKCYLDYSCNFYKLQVVSK